MLPKPTRNSAHEPDRAQCAYKIQGSLILAKWLAYVSQPGRAKETRMIDARLFFWLLVQADYISRRITESGSDLGGVCPDRLYNFASVRDYSLNRFRDTINHNVKKQPRRRSRGSAEHPRAADFANSIVECDTAIAAASDCPAENCFVKICRALDIHCGDLDVAYLAISQSGGHIDFLNHNSLHDSVNRRT